MLDHLDDEEGADAVIREIARNLQSEKDKEVVKQKLSYITYTNERLSHIKVLFSETGGWNLDNALPFVAELIKNGHFVSRLSLHPKGSNLCVKFKASNQDAKNADFQEMPMQTLSEIYLTLTVFDKADMEGQVGDQNPFLEQNKQQSAPEKFQHLLDLVASFIEETLKSSNKSTLTSPTLKLFDFLNQNDFESYRDLLAKILLSDPSICFGPKPTTQQEDPTGQEQKPTHRYYFTVDAEPNKSSLAKVLLDFELHLIQNSSNAAVQQEQDTAELSKSNSSEAKPKTQQNNQQLAMESFLKIIPIVEKIHQLRLELEDLGYPDLEQLENLNEPNQAMTVMKFRIKLNQLRKKYVEWSMLYDQIYVSLAFNNNNLLKNEQDQKSRLSMLDIRQSTKFLSLLRKQIQLKDNNSTEIYSALVPYIWYCLPEFSFDKAKVTPVVDSLNETLLSKIFLGTLKDFKDLSSETALVQFATQMLNKTVEELNELMKNTDMPIENGFVDVVRRKFFVFLCPICLFFFFHFSFTFQPKMIGQSTKNLSKAMTVPLRILPNCFGVLPRSMKDR